jgi:adenylate cyclase
MSLFSELKRRNVFRVAIAYLASAWLLTEVAGTLFPAFGIPDWGVRFIVIIFALGLVPTVFFSWVYELTPEGLKREKDVVREASITNVTAKRLDGITIGLIVLAVLFITTDRLWLGPYLAERVAVPKAAMPALEPSEDKAPETAEYLSNSIAVLSFVNMSNDPDNEYFSDGIAEELLNLLAEIPELRVIARTSSFSYKGKDVKIADVARDLNVSHVLEGSVRKAGNRVRITAQLVQAETNTSLWSATFDRTVDDIFAVQDEIAAEVVAALRVRLLVQGVPITRRTKPEAYSLFLQGRHLQRIGTEVAMRKAEALLQQALAIDPQYAPAWDRLCSGLANQAILGFIDYDDGTQRAKLAAQKALEADPSYFQAHARIGALATIYDRDFETAARHLRLARSLAPNNPIVLGANAILAEALGQTARAIELNEKALIVDPLDSIGITNLAWQYVLVGELGTAEKMYRRALDLGRREDFTLTGLAHVYLYQGRPEDALELAHDIGGAARKLNIISLANFDLGQHEKANAALAKLAENYEGSAASFIAENYAWRGEADSAFEWLDRAIEQNQYMWGSMPFDPAFKNLHDDPRWADFQTRMGRSEEQLKKIGF